MNNINKLSLLILALIYCFLWCAGFYNAIILKESINTTGIYNFIYTVFIIAPIIIGYKLSDKAGSLYPANWAVFSFFFPIFTLPILIFLNIWQSLKKHSSKTTNAHLNNMNSTTAATLNTVYSELSKPYSSSKYDYALKKLSIPLITKDKIDIILMESSALGNAGPGGALFHQAIKYMNNMNNTMACEYFRSALNTGLDPLRQGYAHANIGTIQLKNGDISEAVEEFLKVFTLKQILYESAHESSQYMLIVLKELGRDVESDLFKQIYSRTSEKLGYSLSPEAVEFARSLVKRV
jgi:tetratricopeptide (TPR) repeat protein